MNFKQAFKKLNSKAQGQFFSLTYDITKHADGEIIQKCSLYVDDCKKFFEGPTWESAFESMDRGVVEFSDVEPIDEVEQGE